MWAANLPFISGSETAIFMLLAPTRTYRLLRYSVWKPLLVPTNRRVGDVETIIYITGVWRLPPYIFTKLNGVTFQKTISFIVNNLKTSIFSL